MKLAYLMASAALVSATVHAGINGVEIRRTTDGIPHLRADNWADLGAGVGYVQAQDALCTLAEAFVTYEGRRAWFFGADAQPVTDSTFGRPTNLALDFFFRAYDNADVVAKYRAQNPPELKALIDGYARGYNRYLADAHAGKTPAAACLQQAWVRPITPDDIYRRMYSAQIAGGYAGFIQDIANAQPNAQPNAAPAHADNTAALQTQLAQRVGSMPGLGSNAIALGQQASGEKGGVLLGNPHWFWGGPDRFYQMHLTLPGKLNVAGVGFLGVPVVMIGFNDHVAWSHTVSEARRSGLFELTLDPKDPTRYLVDGVGEAMQPQIIRVPVHDAQGHPSETKRTLYQTRYGPVLDLGRFNPAFGWHDGKALAIRDINSDNFRVFRNFFYWDQAQSLDEFIAIQKREAATPWVNTLAIGRDDGRVWFADIGAAPNVPDALRAQCSTPLAQAFGTLDAHTPFLDGSRAACNWKTDPNAVQPGAFPANAMPSLLRQDYVANMNDSYWLTNPQHPLEGFPSVLGGEREVLSLRSRLGHSMAQTLVAGGARSADVLSSRLMQVALEPHAESADLFKAGLLEQACAQPEVTVAADASAPASAPASAARTVNVKAACDTLQRWSGTANAWDRGALLWEAFWQQLQAHAKPDFYSVAFNPAQPLATPSAPQPPAGQAAQALATAVLTFQSKGWALDEPVAAHRYALSGGQHVPLYGGCHEYGYFVATCGQNDAELMGTNVSANSYLQVVRFDAQGVVAQTLLAHGETETAIQNGAGSAPVERYSRKAWLRFPFTEAQIKADPQLKQWVLRP